MITVLIADDSAFMRAIIKQVLEKNGFKIVGEAENGVECIKKYKMYRPQIVTLDITMSEMGGIQALTTLMAIDPDAKVVMITSMGQEYLIREAITIGAKEFIVKPFKEKQLILTLKKIIEST